MKSMFITQLYCLHLISYSQHNIKRKLKLKRTASTQCYSKAQQYICITLKKNIIQRLLGNTSLGWRQVEPCCCVYDVRNKSFRRNWAQQNLLKMIIFKNVETVIEGEDHRIRSGILLPEIVVRGSKVYPTQNYSNVIF